MKIVALETLQVEAHGNIIWVELHTDQGLVGLGETFRNPAATIAYLHETVAPYLLGQDPRRIERHRFALAREVGSHFQGFPSRSIELRGNSAVDLALWDLLGQATGQPLYQLLGGLTHERVRIYNTCASAGYNSLARTGQDSLQIAPDAVAAGTVPLDDLNAQHQRPAELAAELLAEGITAMKIWPFDAYAKASRGLHIAPAELRAGLAKVEAIRQAHGDAIDLLIEYHGLWQLPAALEIARALDQLGVFWHEDPIAMHRLDDLARFKAGVRGRVAGSENLGSLAWYRSAFALGAVDVATFDLGWVGGFGEAHKITALAEAYDRPIAPHDCTGPAQLVANLHLCAAAPHSLFLETVRAYLAGFYRELLTELPRIEQGYAWPLQGPGLGTALQPDLRRRADVRIRRSALAD